MTQDGSAAAMQRSATADARPMAGKVAVVTGAGRGIGRAIALALAGAGAAVACIARNAAQLDDTVNAIEAAGGRALAIAADVTDEPAIEAAFGTVVQQLGGVDVVFANAGVSERQRVAGSDVQRWWRTFEVNVRGVYLTARAAVPWLRQRGGGKIVVIGSGQRRSVVVGGSSYSGSKAAVWMLVQTLAMELRDEGISVNELIPGPVKTEMTGFGSNMPPGEWVKTPEDVVPMALFLATHPEPGPTAQSFSLMRRA